MSSLLSLSPSPSAYVNKSSPSPPLHGFPSPSPSLPPDTPLRWWPLAVYALDLTALALFLLVLLAALLAVVSVVRQRSHFFNVFWGFKALQCVLAAGWVVGLSLGDVWVWEKFGLQINQQVLCTPVIIAAFGAGQPLFLAALLFTMQLRLTDLVDRYHQDCADSEQGYQPMCNTPLKQLQGVRRRVCESIACRSGLFITIPVLVQGASVPLSMWAAENRRQLILAAQLKGIPVETPVKCYQDWFEFFFQACAQFHLADGGAMPVCRFCLASIMGYVGTFLLFFLLFSHACISAKRQMFNKMMRRAFQRFQLVVSLLVIASATLRLTGFMLEYQAIGPDWVPDLLTEVANVCEAVFLLAVLLAVLRC
eukprot:EG_transcript_11883